MNKMKFKRFFMKSKENIIINVIINSSKIIFVIK